MGRGSHPSPLSLPGSGLVCSGDMIHVAAIPFWGSMDRVAGKLKLLKLDEMKVFQTGQIEWIYLWALANPVLAHVQAYIVPVLKSE